ncbi:unnamed protein product [Polarella glacialis]|uniref:Ubiquitin-like domain-containing protein n=1 Tax=Polarella glacialis TaxID=89957 RepID=A0A813LBU5_POLGL|nr:unnamed protein product [Polarella glacialis]
MEEELFGGDADADFAQFGADSEEWSVGAVHWAAILAIGCLVWWLLSSRGSRPGGVRDGSGIRPDAEELRRKRLEAFKAPAAAASRPAEPAATAPVQAATSKHSIASEETSSTDQCSSNTSTEISSSATVNTTATKSSGSNSSAEGGEGLRQRPVAVVSSSTAAASDEAPGGSGRSTAAAADIAGEVTQVLTTPAPKIEAAEARSLPQDFAIRARGSLRGSQVNRSVEGLSASTLVGQLQLLVLEAFQPEAEGCRLRLFFNGKELKSDAQTIGQLGIVAGTSLQVMFITAVGAATAAAARQPELEDPIPSSGATASQLSSQSTRPRPVATPLSVRVQGSLDVGTGPSVSKFELEDVSTADSVAELEARVRSAFGTGDDVRPRLFYMGKELKDEAAFLGEVGLKPNASITIQAMFVAGQPRGPPSSLAMQGAGAAPGAAAAAPDPASSATALAAAAGVLGSQQQAETADAVMAAAAAAGCNTAALLPGASTGSTAGGAQETSPASPKEAWGAMAALEVQLSRETDLSEDANVRQASGLLRQMLTTATHDSNPAILNFAKAALPDLWKIWSFDPTREHLKGFLALRAVHVASAYQGNENASGLSSSSSSST